MRATVSGVVGGTCLLFFVGLGACTVDDVVSVGDGGSSDDASPPTVDAKSPSDATLDVAADARPPMNDATSDAGDAADGAAPLVARTVADIPDLADFDFTDTVLAFRVGQTLSTCPLAGCTTRTPVGNTTGHNGRFSIAGDRLYFSAQAPGTIQDNVFSVAFDGTNLQNRTNHVVSGLVTESFLGVVSFAGGLTKVEQMVSWARSGEAGYRTLVETTSGASGNPHRVGRTTANSHENTGSQVRYFPKQMRFVSTEANPGMLITPAELSVTGSTLPLPDTNPTAIGTSPRGAGVTQPMVVLREAGILKACPTTTACAAWIDLGDLGDVFALDGQNLYVGGASGLAKCALEEIATRGTCSPNRMSSDPVEAPMYLTNGEVVFKSANRVRAIPKLLGLSCPPGAGAPPGGGICAPCVAGQSPAFDTNTCQACPKGTYSTASGATRCSPCADGSSTPTTGNTSASACAACPSGETSNARTNHLCIALPKRVFLTSESHDADLGGDAALAGATAIAKADAFCMASGAKPASGTFKAMVAAPGLRDAPSLTDWVFAPSRDYVQVDGTTPIGTTNAAGLLSFPLTNVWDKDPASAYAYFWTGIGAASWTTAAGTCQGWTVKTAASSANMGIPGRKDASSIGVGGASLCSGFRRVLCVEQ